jgi:hypothetical protein
MQKIGHFPRFAAGAQRPVTGVSSPTLLSIATLLGCSLFAAGCGSQEQDRNLQPVRVGMTNEVAPIFNDGETQLFEVKRGLAFPIIAPDDASMKALSQQMVDPYGRAPWITVDDVKVQVTWTLSNLDKDGHTVEVLVDPWNEFGRYYPGMQLADPNEQKFEPNLSGIDQYFVLDGASAGDSSRRHGTFTFDDMKEMAVDFATVQNELKTPPTSLPNGFASKDNGMDDPLPVYANHAFNFQNHSWDDPLSAPYIPKVIAGLTGIDFGFRTSDTVACPAADMSTDADGNAKKCPPVVALEITIEIVDLGKDRVLQEGGKETLLAPTKVVVTVGSPVPTGTSAM